MENDYLTDTGVPDIFVTPGHGLQVKVTYGAAGEAPELQVNELLAVRYRDSGAVNGVHRHRTQRASWVNKSGHGVKGTVSFVECIVYFLPLEIFVIIGHA